MASIGVAYFVTLCLYPGIVSEIVSCKYESWMPVILMTAFNVSDLFGKVINKDKINITIDKEKIFKKNELN